jgi:predicted RNA-binding Zn-ribbon protein involved in translation (DUF1610 family)
MTSERNAYLSRVLEVIEQQEARLLVWGVVDGFFESTELALLIDACIENELRLGNEEFLDAREVITQLHARRLIVPVDNGALASGYRTRMAETARLMLRLRQLFPKHSRRPSGWQDAPTLVADFRFQRRRRQYPKRNIPPDEALGALSEVATRSALMAGLKAQLQSADGALTLAGFQVRATERILRAIEADRALATIVCAGTGSGKTLAFYLPALASIVRHRLERPNDRPWVKVVALYPRTELLKDQVREVLKRTLALRRGSPQHAIRIGALFRDTPASAEYCDWKFAGNDRICPLLPCPECGGELRWKEADLRAEVERLRCRDCGFATDASFLPLTRRSLRHTPPDILFTTTEMLNQRMADASYQPLFGVGMHALRAPELVLLDEAHTYEGAHGAQVAYLMRRWQYLIEQPLRFVGLSATLREPESFFASLTGIRTSHVQAISPRPEEIESEGAEYLMALRGDPVSRAALLSTSIQTAMCLQRCLDPRPSGATTSISQGFFGQRTFVFTDDLDVTNRLYFDLLSAEGRNSAGDPDALRAPAGGLAVLRKSGSSLARYRGGQDWRACEEIGHSLDTRLVIERVSSQDRGVRANAEVVIATAALEVGFDDPLVGAVIQHKAPRGVSGFLQRRGRAGRPRGMRPWTIVVLSDYGRDRTAYQAYDQLFDPELPVRTLPLGNRYIRRMQAVFALMDFLATRLTGQARINVWQRLSGPSGPHVGKDQLIKELQTVLETDRATERLSGYVSAALGIHQDETAALLWEFPRPLMSAVIPTALRRLTSNWRADGKEAHDVQVRNNPLPEFIPSTLFSRLNLAEVIIQLPRPSSAAMKEDPAMPLIAALREFAPGRVSRRFGIRHRTERYWIAPTILSPLPAAAALDIASFCTFSLVGEFQCWRGGPVETIPVFRPSALTPSAPPTTVADSSNARLQWHTQLVPRGIPQWLTSPADSVWTGIVKRLGFFTHAAQAPIEVRRFTTGSDAEIGLASNGRVQMRTDFEHAGNPAALGMAFPADAIVVELNKLELHRSIDGDSEKARALRTARFIDQAWRGESLALVPNPFAREWLSHIYLSALTQEAIQKACSLQRAASSVAQGTATVGLREVLSALFQSQIIEADHQQIELSGEDRLRQELDALLLRADVIAELEHAATVLWEPMSDEWEPWLQGVYQSTLASAVLRAIADLCPTLDVEELVADIGRGPACLESPVPLRDDVLEIWISEKGPGGSGHIEEFMRNYAEDPRRFFGMIRAALETSEFELIDHQLRRMLEVLIDSSTSSATQEAVKRFRSSRTHAQMSTASQALRHAMVREGFAAFHGFIVALGTRLLRPGSGRASDEFVAEAMRHWQSEEQRLGIEIDLRVMGYCLSQSDRIDEVAREAGVPSAQDLRAWRMSAISSLLWARGSLMRHASLRLYNPFAAFPPIERLLVIESLRDQRLEIRVTEADWFEKAAALLAAGRLVTLTCAEDTPTALADALNALITNPIEAGYLRAYARLQGLRHRSRAIEADIELLEALS